MSEYPEELAIFNELLDDLGREKATKHELRALSAILCAFERWPELSSDLKKHIISFLPIDDLFRVSMCSREMYVLVMHTPVDLCSVSIRDDALPNQCVAVSLGFRDGRHHDVFFSNDELDASVLVSWRTARYHQRCERINIAAADYQVMAARCAAVWMSRCAYTFDHLSVDLYRDTRPFQSQLAYVPHFPNCVSLHVGAIDEQWLRFWLSKTPERLDELHVTTSSDTMFLFAMSNEVLRTTHVVECQEVLDLQCHTTIDDDTFAMLKSNVICLHSYYLTEHGLTRYLNNWANGHGASNICEVKLSVGPHLDRNHVLNELADTVVPFLELEPEFMRGFERGSRNGFFCQVLSRVDPFESVTLCFFDMFVAIYGTGKRAVGDDGTPYTQYFLPPFNVVW